MIFGSDANDVSGSRREVLPLDPEQLAIPIVPRTSTGKADRRRLAEALR